MELNKTLIFWKDMVKKYKYVLLIIVIGLLLLVIPSPTQKTESVSMPVDNTSSSIRETEERLSDILSKVTGAGKVTLMLTIAKGEETLYQTNDKTDKEENNSNIKQDTVTVTDAQRNQNGLVKQVIPVTYQGALVICQGADDPTVRFAIVDAVSKLTGLGTNKISVLKMK